MKNTLTRSGVILAGGAATRLPNKPLLPRREGGCVIDSSVEYLLHQGIKDITVIVPPNSVITDYLMARYDHLNFIEQPNATGVEDALNLTSGSRMICVADNIYPKEEPWTEEGVVVRPVPAWRARHLATLLNGRYQRGRYESGLALTTPWMLPDMRFTNLLPQLQKLMVLEGRREGWWDIGTPEAYAAYWRHTCD